MTVFPLLSTGAVAQYPLNLSSRLTTQVLRFLDGSDQRYVLLAQPLRTWQIKLTLLNESEMQMLELFFSEQLGSYSTFSFPDPYSGALVPNCRLADGAFISQFLETDSCQTTITVVETNG